MGLLFVWVSFIALILCFMLGLIIAILREKYDFTSMLIAYVLGCVLNYSWLSIWF